MLRHTASHDVSNYARRGTEHHDTMLASIERIMQCLQLPPEIQRSYDIAGVKQLYDWQRECLFNTGAIEGKHLIYCAPTSGGKTLVAELVMLRTVILKGKKALFVLPYVSLVIEKEKQIRKLLTLYNRSKHRRERIKVRGFHGDHAGSRSYKENILICTIEKANGIIHSLHKRGKMNLLGCMLLDEMHVIGGSFNGHLLEILISKVKYINQMNYTATKSNIVNYSKEKKGAIDNIFVGNDKNIAKVSMIQIIAMSATMGNIEQLAQWMEASLYRTTFRPIPLFEHIKAGANIYHKNGEQSGKLPNPPANDSDHILFLCSRAMRQGQQVLIFCPSKSQCHQTCKLLYEQWRASVEFRRQSWGPFAEVESYSGMLYHGWGTLLKKNEQQVKNACTDPAVLASLTVRAEHLRSSRQAIVDEITNELNRDGNDVEKNLIEGVKDGIAFHHAGLGSAVRVLLERAFRAGDISILAATSTLAAGVNLPAGCVLIRSLKIGYEDLSIVQYKQMSGRAGRAGQGNSTGESILLVNENQRDRALQLVNSPMPAIKSQLNPSVDSGNGLLKALLEMIGLQLIISVEDIYLYCRQTLFFCQQQTCDSEMKARDGTLSSADMERVAIILIQFLVESGMVMIRKEDGNFIQCEDVQSFSSQFIEIYKSMKKLKITATRLGRAIVESGVHPDEAIVLYESLLRAQDGVNLESPLQLLYLVTPLEHKILPNFEKMLTIYERSKQTPGKQIADVFDSVGISYADLNRWRAKSPSKSLLETCSAAVRLQSLNSSINDPVDSALRNNQPGDNKSQKSIKQEELKLLCCAKRLWAASALLAMTSGQAIVSLTKEYCVDPAELKQLQRHAKLMSSKVVRLCECLGWSAVATMIKEFRSSLDVNLPKDLARLLDEVPGMTRRMGTVLIENNVDSREKFLLADPSSIAQLLQLSIGFELQKLEDVDEFVGGQNVDATINITRQQPTDRGTTLSRDQAIQHRLVKTVESLQEATREIKQSEIEQKDLKTYSLLSALDNADRHDAHGPIMHGSVKIDEPNADGEEEYDDDIDSLLTEDMEEDDEIDDILALEYETLTGLSDASCVYQDSLPMSCGSSMTQFSLQSKESQASLSRRLEGMARLTSQPIAVMPEPTYSHRNCGDDFGKNNSHENLDKCSSKISHSSSFGSISGDNLGASKHKIVSLDNTAFISAASLLMESLEQSKSIHEVKLSCLTHNNSSGSTADEELRLQETSFSSSSFAYVPPQPNEEVTLFSPTIRTEVCKVLTDDELSTLMENLESSGVLQSSASATSAEVTKVQVKESTSSHAAPVSNYRYYPLQNTEFTSIEGKKRGYSALDSFASMIKESTDKITGSVHFDLTVTSPLPQPPPLKRPPKDTSIESFSNNYDEFDSIEMSHLLPEDFQIDEELAQFVNNFQQQKRDDQIHRQKHDESTYVLESNGVEIIANEDSNQSYSDVLIKAGFDTSMTISGTFADSKPIEPHEDQNIDHKNEKAASPTDYMISADDISPYLTPFTPSKKRSPGKYLYYPIWHSENGFISPGDNTCLKRSFSSKGTGIERLIQSNDLQDCSILIAHDSNDSPIQPEQDNSLIQQHRGQNISPDTPSSPPEILEDCYMQSIPKFPKDIVPAMDNSFQAKDVRDARYALNFLERLKSVRCVSFELIFRPLPISWLARQGDVDASSVKEFLPEFTSERNKDNCDLRSARNTHHVSNVNSWAPFISWTCSSKSCVSSTSHDHYLDTLLKTDIGFRRNMFKEPVVLIGAALNFGDDCGYYLPLPTPLPLFQNPFSKRASVVNEQRHISGIDKLPLRCCELISAFVGFDGIIHKCYVIEEYIKKKHSKYAAQCPSIGQQTSSTSAAASPVINPLLTVSRRWCYASRRAILTDWQQGGCIEWRLFSDIMYDNSITKVAVHLKSKLVALRERDIIVRGPIEDPTVAQSLLENSRVVTKSTNEMKEPPTIFTSSAPCTLQIPKVDFYPKPRKEVSKQISIADSGDGSSFAVRKAQKIACFRSIAVIRAMALLEKRLQHCELLDLFRNLEMSVLFSAADAEFSGIRIDSQFFGKLRQALRDRQEVIMFYFRTLCGPNVNLDSVSDVSDIRKKLTSLMATEVRKLHGIGDMAPAKQQQHITKAIEHAVRQHPWMRLISEYRSHIRTVPMLSSVLSNRFFERVRATYASLGTETGRIIITTPPLQQIPHVCTFLCSERPSLHEEIQSCSTKEESTTFIMTLNSKLASVSDRSLSSSNNVAYEWVKVSPLCNLGENDDQRQDVTNTITAKLVKVMDVKISENCCSNNGDTQYPLVDIWRGMGHAYTDDEAQSILQVLVEFPSNTKEKTGLDADFRTQSLRHEPHRYCFPADKVFRLSACIKPNQKEIDLISSGTKSEFLSRHFYKVAKVNFQALSGNSVADIPDIKMSEVSVRNGFCATDRFVLLAADYCQMELRILAHYCGDPGLISAFKSQKDVFLTIAAQWLKRDVSTISVEERNQVKQLCYALIYGAGPASIAAQANVTEQQASDMLTSFLSQYPRIKRFLNRTKAICRRDFAVRTLLGRQRSIPDIRSVDMKRRSKAERQAVNTVCQGTAADLIKLSMINIHCKLSELTSDASRYHRIKQRTRSYDMNAINNFSFHQKRSNPGGSLYRLMDDVRPVLQVHDELLYEVHPHDLHLVAAIVKHCMENAVVLNVPLQVKLSVGHQWGDLKPLVFTEDTMKIYSPLFTSPTAHNFSTEVNVQKDQMHTTQQNIETFQNFCNNDASPIDKSTEEDFKKRRVLRWTLQDKDCKQQQSFKNNHGIENMKENDSSFIQDTTHGNNQLRDIADTVSCGVEKVERKLFSRY